MLFVFLILVEWICYAETNYNYLLPVRSKRAAFNKNLLPAFETLFGTKSSDGSTSYELFGCSIESSKDRCVWTFEPDQTCTRKLSLGKVFDFLSNKKFDQLESLKRNTFYAGAFAVKKIVLNTCGDNNGDVEFSCGVIEPFDVVNDKAKIINGDLNFKFNYVELKSNFNFKNIEFDISGKIKIASLTVSVEVKKEKESSSSTFEIFADKIKVIDFSKKIFNFNALSGGDAIVGKRGMFSNMVVNKPTFKIIKNEDGSYVIVLSGEATGITGFGEINALMVIQKPSDAPIGVAIATTLKNVKPLKIISKIVKKDLDISILNNLELDTSIEYASKDIVNLDDPKIKEMLSGLSASDSGNFSHGTIISFNFPIDKILNKNGKLRSIAIKIIIQKENISIVFPPDIFDDGKDILAALVPNVNTFLRKFFKSNFKIIFKKFDINIKSKDVEISIAIPEKLSLGNHFLSVENTVFTLKMMKSADPNNRNKKEFSFSLESQMKLGSTSISISAEKKEGNINFKGSIEFLSFSDLLSNFGINGLLKYIPEFSFAIENLNINAEIGDKKTLSISGKPILFDWKDTQIEFIKEKTTDKKASKYFSVNNEKHAAQLTNQSSLAVDTDLYKVDFPQSQKRNLITKRQSARRSSDDDITVLVILMNNINFESFIQKILNKESTNTKWITLDISLVYSNSEISAESLKNKNIFTTKEIQEAVQDLSNGLLFRGKMMLPKSADKCCVNGNNKCDQLCQFAVNKLGASSSLSVNAGYIDKKFFLEAKYNGYLSLGNVIIKSIAIGVKVTNVLQLYICGELTLKLEKEDLNFKVFITLSSSGELELGGKMNSILKNPFGVQKFALGDLAISAKLQLPFAISGFSFSGTAWLGTDEKHIKISIAVGIEINGLDNYFYGSLNELTLGKLSDTFGYNLKNNFPDWILESGFRNLKIGFTTNKEGKDITLKNEDFHIENGFQLKGIVNILGFEAKLDVEISTKKLLIKCYLSKIDILSGALKLTRSLSDINEGPKVLIDISSDSKQIVIEGAISILGISQAIKIDIGKEKMEFTVSGKLLDIVEADLSVVATYANENSLEKASFQVSSCLSSVDDATNEANNIFKDAAEKTEEIVKYTDKEIKKYSLQYEKLLATKELLDNVGKKLFEKMAATFNKIEQYQSKIEYSCTRQCNKEVGYFSKNWCSSNCLLDKGERSIRVEANKKKQEVRSMWWGIFERIKDAVVDFVEKGAKSIYNGVMDVIGKVADTEIFGKKVSDYVEIGLDLIEKTGKYIKDKALSAINKVVTIHLICFETSLDKAFRGKFNFNANVTFLGSNKVYEIESSLNFDFLSNIAKIITDTIYPGMQYIGSALETVREKVAKTFGRAKKMREEILLKEKEIEKLKEDVDKDIDGEEVTLNDDASDDFITKNNIKQNITIDDIKRQIYNEFHIVSLTDEDALETLDTNPDYTLEINFEKNESVDISDLTHQMVNEKNNCKLAQGLVRNYEKISNQLNKMLAFLENQKQLHKKQCLDANHKYSSLEKTAIEKCKRAKCNKRQREKLVYLAHSLSHAHVMRTEKLDEAFEAIGKRLIKNEKEMMTRNVNSSGMNMKRFLSNLKHSTKRASLLPSTTNEYRLHLNASYKAVRDLLQGDQPYQDVVQNFQSMKNNLAFLRENISCAA
ncbi:uncharacterized protein LOC105849018 isoform X2 [Hydra vulgaris]|nr:uncharacterized protein LOC105849018 isoform X2 [Hydra vulgaris]